MDPHDFLDLAGTLADGMSEAEWRSAVSRAYYGVFHLARKLLLQCGFSVPQADQAHAYLWLRLSNSGHPDMQSAGADLKVLRSKRNQADYDLFLSLNHVRAVDHFNFAQRIANVLDDALDSPEILARITAAIRQYETTVLKQTTWKP
jgi:uncharacterized protein (UPF0332 family)